jgi:hypothetical protein
MPPPAPSNRIVGQWCRLLGDSWSRVCKGSNLPVAFFAQLHGETISIEIGPVLASASSFNRPVFAIFPPPISLHDELSGA